ncbi:TRAP transporter large permease [Celeribacter halophilus]|uniref:TRAP transporter large permease n=1 Tax=Celeribacter halophilus TaxID=576117 RepID=UPI001C097DF2|nr:TRAP transporter large permease [Celeribacter halophilus]MBU2888151.1 TRAP transporter large permease [Celeribacter halophilus]MDO6512118.1 TRAP transporter large permease [Celeribacter halophilus]
MNPLILMDAGLLTLLLIIGVPVPFCFAGAALLLMMFGDFGSTSFLVGAGFNKLNSIVLIAIPLYILAGGIMGAGGIATRLVDLADSIIGRLRGGLGLVLIVTTAVFGAISGMASSAVAAIGTVMIPRMVERGFDRGYAAALVAASSVLALLIPPSASMILYGWVTGTSILACFLAPIVPGLILLTLLGFWNLILTRRMPLKQPEPAPMRAIVGETFIRTKKAAAGLMMPLIILGFIYGGITTPTEAAAVAVVYAIPVAIYVYREMTWSGLGQVLWRAGQTSGVLMIMIFFASMLGRIWTLENVPQEILESFLSVSENPIVLLLLANLFLMIIGMFMEDVSGILLAAPLLLPVMKQAGVDPIHFSAIIATNLGMGLITPPTAPLLYFAALIGKTSLSGMLKPALVFVFFAYLPVVLLTTFIPALSMWLPSLVLGLN